MFEPKFSITSSMAANLMVIQKAATIVDTLPLPTSLLKDLQKQSRESTVLLSTKIEGNRMSEPAKRQAMYQRGEGTDQQEVYNLAKALEFLDDCEKRGLPITEDLIKKLHAIIRVIPYGRRPKASEYRTEPVQVGERNHVNWYLPPEWQDVPQLMNDLVAWVNSPACAALPAPVQAAIFMWQFLTIHPYTDGNGRTARMLATYILRRAGLGLKGLFVLESYYDRDIDAYYDNLQMGLHHNYYFGRNSADLTQWIEFFLRGLAEVFSEAARAVQERSSEYTRVEPPLLRDLDPQQRIVFAQLAFRFNWLTTTDLRRLLGIADRTVRGKVRKWIDEGFLVPRDEHAERVRSVMLGPKYQKLAQQVLRDPERYRYLLR